MRTTTLGILVGGSLAVAAASGACGSATSDVGPGAPGSDAGMTPVTPPVGPGAGAGGLPCNVDAVLEASCRKCHGAQPSYGAPMPMVTLADLKAPAKSNPARPVYELVAERIADDVKPMPQPPNARLSAADRATLTSWSAAGAPAGTAACTPTPTSDAGPPPPMTTCVPDLPIAPASDYEMAASTGDEYVCYGVELSRPTPTQVVGFAPRIDNKTIVHHLVLFEADAAVSSTPAPCSAGGSLQWRMVTGWAPGGDKGFELPPEAGFPLKTGGTTHYVMQVHYSNPQGLANQKDHSGYDLCTSAPRKYDADVLAFGTQNIHIPAGAAQTQSKCSITIPAQLSGIHMIAAMPHMHKLGADMTTSLFAGGASGAATDLGTVHNWSFNTQAWLNIGTPGAGGAVASTNDVITTTCTWKNNNTGADVTFGQNTADEMCYSFTTYYPRISSPVWSWAAPALSSQCTTTSN